MTNEQHKIKNEAELQVGILTQQVHQDLQDVDLNVLAERTGLPKATLRDFASRPIANKSAIHLKMITDAVKSMFG